MLTIFASTDYIDTVKNIISEEYRLDELVEIKDFLKHKPEPSGFVLIVNKKGIAQPIDWYNVLPPFILPEHTPLSKDVLLGLVFSKLGNYEKGYFYLNQTPLLKEIDIINRLQNGIPINPDELATEYSEFDEYRLMHNQAILRHYASTETDFDAQKTRYFYREAMNAAPNDEYKAFTAKHLGLFLTDLQQWDDAENVLLAAADYALSDDAKIELKNALCAIWLQKLTVPYDKTLLAHLKETLWEVLQVYEKQGRALETGLVLVDAAHIANISDSFSEALGYISRAVDIFKKEKQRELLANAQLKRGTLLYTWAKNGSPQFFKGAMDSYQEALKVFNREDTPSVFADIQHHLGVIYSEIPDEVKRKSLWAAISSSSFQEALNFYTKEYYPYEYAMICNSYGNALTKYPMAIHSDNHEKALFYYQEALNVRTATAYPIERALTLLNYIEGCWNIGNETEDFNEARYNDMVLKANEIKNLTEDAKLIQEANEHLEKLKVLKKAFV